MRRTKNGFEGPGGRKLTPGEEGRVRRLGIPPNWTDVWVSLDPSAHLQVTGRDQKGRVQYIYHPLWVLMSQDEKYGRMARFQEKLPMLRKALREEGGVIELMFRILLRTHIRVGNDFYAKDNGTYGLCSLLYEHVSVRGSTVTFDFIGKKGVPQKITVGDPKMASGLREVLCGLRKGQKIFNKDPEDLNEFLQTHMGREFTCKDFRTYASNIHFLRNLCQRKTIPETIADRKKVLKEVYEETAEKLGHTSEISKKSYVMPVVSDCYLRDPHLFRGKDPERLLRSLVRRL